MYDVIIIGKGPAGVSAALYTVRSNLKTLIIGKDDSVLKKAEKIENYYGFTNVIKGEELLKAGEIQVANLGAEIIEEEVIAIESNGYFTVKTNQNSYKCKGLLLATGQPQKKVKLHNIKDFEGKGISYCTTCDGFFYNNLKVGVLGNKDFAVHEATELESYSKNITIYTNGQELEVTEKNKEEIKKYRVNKKKISRLEGKDFLEGIVFEDESMENIDGLFVANESASSIDFARKLGLVVEGNSIVVDRNQRTNLEGLFAAGDCTGGFKQIATAVGQGALAGKKLIEFVRGKSNLNIG